MPPKVWIKLTSALTCVAFCGKGYTMRLEMGLVDIKNVRFGSRTIIDDHTLLIDRQELISLLAQEPLFDSIEIDLAHPGESCRITYVLDVLEPRYRLNGPNFPGALEARALRPPRRDRRIACAGSRNWWHARAVPPRQRQSCRRVTSGPTTAHLA